MNKSVLNLLLLCISFVSLNCDSRNVFYLTDEEVIDGGILYEDAQIIDLSNIEKRFPHLAALPSHKETILKKIEREPYKSILKEILNRSNLLVKSSNDNVWDVDVNGYNAKIAQANAFLGWLFDNRENAEKAINILMNIKTNFEDREDRTDIDVNMPQVLQGYINALDFLKGTVFISVDEIAEIERKIIMLADQFYDGFIEDDFTHTFQFKYSQNNHNIRAASALAYAAISFPDYKNSRKWRDWAFSELDFFFRPENHYIMPDGSVSEGPFYGMFAWQSSAILFIALSNLNTPIKFKRVCKSRIYSDPWNDYICNEGEDVIFENFIYNPIFHKFVDWYISIRLPSGSLPPLEDSMFKTYAGTVFLNSFGAKSGIHYWNWKNNRDFSYMLDQSDDFSIYNLIYFDDSILPEAPEYKNRFMIESGHMVFRSDWSYDAIWLLLTAEKADQRKAAHDHVDGTSFSLAAYGEYLLIDPGYVKDESSKIFKVKTANPQAHNVILIDGEGAPSKEPFPAFGDCDAELSNYIDGKYVDYVEAHQSYQNADIERDIIFVNERYFVVVDLVKSEINKEREFRWRLNGYAGYGSGGNFILGKGYALWERENAGVEVYLSSPDGVEISEPTFIKGEVPHVHKFDLNRETTEHGVIDGITNAISPAFLSLLLPYKVGSKGEDGRISVESSEPISGIVCYRIRYADNIDIAIIKARDEREEFQPFDDLKIDTDARFLLFRFDKGLSFILIKNGSFLNINGRDIVNEKIRTRLNLIE